MSDFVSWFNPVDPSRDFILKEFKGKNNLSFLEIGSFTGESAVWFAKNIITGDGSTLTCVDPWSGEIIHDDVIINFEKVEKVFDTNTQIFKDKIIKIKSTSQEFLIKNREKKYDFIYIDGDHNPQAVLSDAVLSWDLLKLNGIMSFDDYGFDPFDQYGKVAYSGKSHSSPAIDAFARIYFDNIRVIEKEKRFTFQKISNTIRQHDFDLNKKQLIENVFGTLGLIKGLIKEKKIKQELNDFEEILKEEYEKND